MTLPTHIDDLEKQKFADASGAPVVRVAGTAGEELANQATLAALSAKLPAAIGQTTMAASMSVAIASNQGNVAVNPFGITATVPARKCFNIAKSSIVIDTATDIFCIIGPTSGVVYITRIDVSSTLNSAATLPLTLIKRSTADTGGVAVAVAATANAQTDTTTAYANVYTTAPTGLGTESGVVDSARFHSPNTTGRAPHYVWQCSEFDRPVVLSAATDCLCVNLGSTSVNGTFAFNVQFYQIG